MKTAWALAAPNAYGHSPCTSLNARGQMLVAVQLHDDAPHDMLDVDRERVPLLPFPGGVLDRTLPSEPTRLANVESKVMDVDRKLAEVREMINAPAAHLAAHKSIAAELRELGEWRDKVMSLIPALDEQCAVLAERNEMKRRIVELEATRPRAPSGPVQSPTWHVQARDLCERGSARDSDGHRMASLAREDLLAMYLSDALDEIERLRKRPAS